MIPMLSAVLLVLVFSCVAGRAAAQERVDVDALLKVEAMLTGTATRNLDLGTVVPGGGAHTVTPDDVQTDGCSTCASGAWMFGPLSNSYLNADVRYVQLTFSRLPTELRGPDGATLPVSYRARACLLADGARYHCYEDWTPAAGQSQSFQQAGMGSPTPLTGYLSQRMLEVYLGGLLAAPADQAAGEYVETITLTISYSRT